MPREKFYSLVPWFSLAVVALILAFAFLQPKNGPMPLDAVFNGSFGSSTREMGGDMAFPGKMQADFDESFLYYPEEGFLSDEFSDTTPQVIKTGYLSLTVQHTEATATALVDVAATYGGTVINKNINQYEEVVSGYVTLTVEASQFDTAIEEIKALALVVDSETVNADDVTETVIDLEARLRNALAEEARYLEILGTANTVEEILLVEQNLAMVRERIESFESQLNYYEERTDYATITVSMTEETAIEIGGTTFRPKQDVIDAVQTVIDLLQELVTAVIYVLIVGGSFLIPIFLVTMIVRSVKKAKK